MTLRRKPVNWLPKTMYLALTGVLACTGTQPESEPDLELLSEPAAADDEPVAAVAEVAEFMGSDDGVNVDTEVAAARVSREPLPDITHLRPERPTAVPRSAKSPTDVVLEQAASKPPGETIQVLVALDSEDFDFAGVARMVASARAEVIDQRRAQLAPGQDRAADGIAALGGAVTSRHWIQNSLAVEIPASAAAELAALPGVVKLYPWAEVTPGLAYDGTQIRDAVLADPLIAVGHDGEYNGRVSAPSDNIKIGVLEPGPINPYHVGWRDWSGGPTRLQGNYECDAAGCSAATPTSASGHGTWVTWAIAGSVEQGQDSSYPGSYTAAQKQRSGMLREADIYYYDISGCGLVDAYEQAIADGVDVMNMSIGTSCGGGMCETNYDCCGLNATIKTALDAGILPVGCAGNTESAAGECTLWYPGFRSEVVAAAGLGSTSGTDYGSTTKVSWMSDGPFPITTRSGLSTSTAGVDLAAPGGYTKFFTSGTSGYSSGDAWGCSMATPIITGAAGMLRSALNSIGWSGNDARALMVNLLLLGDASDGTASGKSTNQVSKETGYGRLRLHVPTSQSMQGPWGWGWRSFVIHQGETVKWTVGGSGAESSYVTDWKWALLWTEPDMSSTSDIVIKVYDTCPAGGGEQWVAGDYSFGLRKRVRLNQSQISGRCLEMRATAYQTPAGGTRVYSADYYHGGDPAQH